MKRSECVRYRYALGSSPFRCELERVLIEPSTARPIRDYRLASRWLLAETEPSGFLAVFCHQEAGTTPDVICQIVAKGGVLPPAPALEREMIQDGRCRGANTDGTLGL